MDESCFFFAIPENAPIRSMTLGQNGFLSSIGWVESIFLFADATQGTKNLELSQMLQMVTTLDPLWQYPYEFSGLVLEEHGHLSKDGEKILRRGINRFPESWQLRVYLAMGLLARGESNESVAEILLPISTGKQHAPENIRNLAFTMLARDRNLPRALALICDTYHSIDDPVVRLQLKGKLQSSLDTLRFFPKLDTKEFVAASTYLLGSQDSTQVAVGKSMIVGLSTNPHQWIPSAIDLTHQWSESQKAN